VPTTSISGGSHLWYLSTEMAIFYFSPFILMTIHFVGRKFGFIYGLVTDGIMTLASTLLILSLAIAKDWPLSIGLLQ